VIITAEQAYAYAFGDAAAAIARGAAFEIGLQSSRSVGAGVLTEWALDKPDDDVDLQALLAALDALGWVAAAALHE
jgi:hypothetical protein